jgi:hypothetical protein
MEEISAVDLFAFLDLVYADIDVFVMNGFILERFLVHELYCVEERSGGFAEQFFLWYDSLPVEDILKL